MTKIYSLQVKRLMALTLIFSLCFWQSTLSAQNDCASAVALVIDANCGGAPGGAGANSGDPTGNDLVDGNVCSADYSTGDDYIFTYTATTTDALQLDLYATNTWSGIMMTDGCPTVGTCFAFEGTSATGASLLTPAMTMGTTYYIHVSTYATPQSTGQFCMDAALVVPPTPPANDACAGATNVTATGNFAGSTDLANSADAPAACDGGNDCPDFPSTVTSAEAGVWFVYNSTGPETITIESTGFDTELMVFEGSCGGLTCVAGDDDSGAGSGSKICWNSTASLTGGGDPNRSSAPVNYYIYLDGHATGTGTYSLDVSTAPLPVELISFEGIKLKSTNQLNWATASELGTEYFSVERSHNGFDSWREVGKIEANGNSVTRLNYQFEDKNPMANSYYRLRTVDYDRSEQNSEVVNLTRKAEGFVITSAFPNPTKDMITVQYHSSKNAEVTVLVNDIIGRLINSYKVEANDGFNNLEVQLNNVAPGTYFLSLSNEVNRVVQRIVKQ